MLNPTHNAPIVYEFSTKIKGNRKTKFDAYYKVLELLEIEFKKIEPKLMLQVAVKIIKEIYKSDFDNDYKELIKFAKLLEHDPQHAHDRFFIKVEDLYFKNFFCERIQMDVYENYLYEPYLSVHHYNNNFIDSIYDKTFFNNYKINNKALANEIRSYTAKILENKTIILTNPKPPTGRYGDFKELTQQAIILFHLQDDKNFTIPYDERPAFANELFIKLENALSPNDKELAISYLTDEKEFSKDEAEVSSYLEFANFKQKFEADINAKIYKYVNLWNKYFWTNGEIEKQAIQNQGKEIRKQIVNDYLDGNLNKEKAKCHSIAVYGRLWDMKRKRRVSFIPYEEIISPKKRIDCYTSYLTETEKTYYKICHSIKFKPKEIVKIANFLESGLVQKANDIYTERRQKQREKVKNGRETVTYPNHAHKGKGFFLRSDHHRLMEVLLSSKHFLPLTIEI